MSSPTTEMLRPTVMEVKLDAIEHNLGEIRALAKGGRVMAVVKANAYGHGLAVCGDYLEKFGVDYFGVALLEEGIELRKSGVSSPILVFGGIFGSQIKLFLDFDLELTASSVDKLRAINEVASASGKRARVHLKIDTGMERVGVHYYSCGALIDEVKRASHCDVVGVFSHLATADEEESKVTAEQLSRFAGVVDYCKGKVSDDCSMHILNSAGLLSVENAPSDIVRPGLAVYGVYPAPHLLGSAALRPAMTLKTRVVYFKVVKKGAGVSYGHRWHAPCDTRVVTVPLGYGDGFFRNLSNRGHVLIRGKRYPIVGSVCMDQMMINIGDGEAYNGDEVVLIGEQGAESISAGEVADLAETVPHQVLTSTNLRVPRCYYYDGKLLGV